jgi:LysM repeat protein
VALILLLAAYTPQVYAQDQVVHVVQPGENLFRIALYYGTTVDAIQNANGLGSAHIHVGQRLTIPGATTTQPPTDPLTPPGEADSGEMEGGEDPEEPAGTNQPAGEEQPAGTDAPVGIDARSYLVQAGDTLSGIAARFGISHWALVEENGLAGWSVIYVGQELVIPGGDASETVPQDTGAGGEAVDEGAADENAVDETHTDIDPQTYTVQPGDTLFSIANRFGLTVAAISRLNGIANPSQIYVGQVLRLTGEAPAPVATGGGKLILIDLSEQHLYAYQGDELVYSFVASSGAAPYYTRVGEFRVQSKIPNAYGSAWDIWMPNWLGIYYAGSTENGIHALPMMPNGTVLWAGYLGSPVSYGCIVLGTHESQLLYDWAEIGTAVSIRY